MFDRGSPEKVTHTVVVEDGRKVLKRSHFACWCCGTGAAGKWFCR